MEDSTIIIIRYAGCRGYDRCYPGYYGSCIVPVKWLESINGFKIARIRDVSRHFPRFETINGGGGDEHETD
jgi:hypothetical protein